MCQCDTDAPIFVCEKKSLYGAGLDVTRLKIYEWRGINNVRKQDHSLLQHLGLVTTKPVFGVLQQSKFQTSLLSYSD